MFILIPYKFHFKIVLRLVTPPYLGQESSRSDSKQAQGGWNEANTTLLQRRWYCSGTVLALFEFRMLSVF